MNELFIEELCNLIGKEAVYTEEEMSKHTSFRTGGPADVLVNPSADQVSNVIKLCKQYKIPYLVIGNGSNLLVGDKGIRGLVIEIGKSLSEITIEGTRIQAGAGALISTVAKRAVQEDLTGLEFASGIPGSIGGAVVMNAGAYGGEIKNVLVSVKVLDTKTGEIKILAAEDLALSYRHSVIPEKEYIVLSAELSLEKGNAAEIAACMEELKEKRITKQPLEYPSAGSTFKRPEGYFAGKLIEDAGLRGYRVGGAQVSEKHCGFVINREHATSADVRKLMEDVAEKVYAMSGVTLEPEVKFIGEF